MSQIHFQSLVIGDTSYHLVKCGTNNAISICQMFKIVKEKTSDQKFHFPTEGEYNLLVEEMKNFPDGWKGFVSRIAFELPHRVRRSYDEVRYIVWYGKGGGRRWREAKGYSHDVMPDPGCIILRRKNE